MALFRRKQEETLNEQMLREAGLDADSEGEPATDPDELGLQVADPFAGTYPADDPIGAWRRAMARPGEYDAVITVEAAGIPGDVVEFATLPGGDVIVDTEQGDADLSPFADAIEAEVAVPYRVLARRQDGDLWALAARGIDVLELDFDGGDEIELACQGGEIDLRVDGEPWNEPIRSLERAGEAAEGEDYVVQAERLDGDLWEIRASPL